MKALNQIKQRALLLLLLLAVGQAMGQGYENVLKADSTSWVTCHLELEDKEEGHAFVNTRDSLLYYAPYGNTNYYCVGRMREDDGRLWITYSEHSSEEILLMDMNLEEGEEFLVTPYRVARVVETIYENGRKVIVFDYVSQYWDGEPLKFIEGVGRNYMLFEWYGDIDRDYQTCKFDGVELVYSTANPLFDVCKIDNTSIEELSNEDETVEIYPNPASDEVSIRFFCFQETPLEIIVLDLSGKAVKSIPVTGNDASLTLTVSNLRRGVYGIKVVCQNRVLTKKLVIN